MAQFYKLRNMAIIFNVIVAVYLIVTASIYIDDINNNALYAGIIIAILTLYVPGIIIFILITNRVKYGNVVPQYIGFIYTIYRIYRGLVSLVNTFSLEYFLVSFGTVLEFILILFTVYIFYHAVKLAKQVSEEFVKSIE